MTTNETRDIDRACAEAMGWTKPSTRGRCDRCGWAFSPVAETGCTPSSCSFRTDRPFTRADEPARYSTDPSTQAEKLRWLRANIAPDEWVEIYNRDDWVVMIWSEWAEHAQEGPGGAKMPRGEGTTIDEALAHLVCAVAKAKKEQGK